VIAGNVYCFVFTDNEAEKIIDALDELKILDPACGSGAFPVGTLQKVVFILNRLDPDNTKWRKQQKNRLIAPLQQDLEITKKLSSESARAQAEKELKNEITEIENDFNNNPHDYTRKLYIIQNSIYGIDIQSIAIQISKLRFFLSLIIEQNIDFSKRDKNYLLKPLPNLETKFVAADTLKEIDRTNAHLFRTDEIVQIENQLFDLRQKYFNSQNRQHKRELEKQDETLRNQLSITLKKLGFDDTTADQLAHWDPYNHNQTAPFFDSEWMFGHITGFDIIIGNPPYIKEYTNRKAFDSIRGTKYYQGKMDLWYAFACKGIDWLKQNGVLTFIATNNWITNAGASILRNKVIEDTKLLQLVDFNSYMIFRNASVQTNVFVLQKNKTDDSYTFDYRKIEDEKPTYDNVLEILQDRNQFTPIVKREMRKDKSLHFSSVDYDKILEHIASQRNFTLDEKKEVAQGIVTPQDALNRKNLNILGNDFYLNQGIFVITDNELNSLNLNDREMKLIKPLYTTNELLKIYANRNNKFWIIYTDSSFKNSSKIKPYPNIKQHLDRFQSIITSSNKPYGLHRSRKEEFFKGEKITSLRMCSKTPVFSYTNFDCYVLQTYFVIKSFRINLKYLSSLLNSTLIHFWLKQKSGSLGNVLQIDKPQIMNIPIKKIENTQPFEILVDYILHSHTLPDSNKDKKFFISYFQQMLNQMFYELYFESVTKLGYDIIKHLADLPKLTGNSEKDNLLVKEQSEKYSHEKHPVSKAIYYNEVVPEIKIIQQSFRKNGNE
ncbi:MAG: Eco57I restriction-modification methylase domain-containing protein, partial [Bacteroidales bacterium]|nr:Eco57I restriction-modification methylase domain-containing protein [Bacteroidales bacterium]